MTWWCRGPDLASTIWRYHRPSVVHRTPQQHVREFKETLAKLPKHLSNKLRAETLPEIIKTTKNKPGERLQAGGVTYESRAIERSRLARACRIR